RSARVRLASRIGGGMSILDSTLRVSGTALKTREYGLIGIDAVSRALGQGSRAIYLDANATTSPLKAVVDAVTDVMRSDVGNPSSAHASGAASRRLMENARDRVCGLFPGSGPENIIFVSGGTEANNLVIGSF